MKSPFLFLGPTVLAALLMAGCGHIDTTPMAAGDANRVLTGRVEAQDGSDLPADAVVLVRVVDPSRTLDKPPNSVLGSPTTVTVRSTLPPKVLGEQEIRHPGSFPVAFRVEYTAIDEQLREGLNVEVRISVGGRVRYINVSSSAVTLTNYTDPHIINVNQL